MGSDPGHGPFWTGVITVSKVTFKSLGQLLVCEVFIGNGDWIHITVANFEWIIPWNGPLWYYFATGSINELPATGASGNLISHAFIEDSGETLLNSIQKVSEETVRLGGNSIIKTNLIFSTSTPNWKDEL